LKTHQVDEVEKRIVVEKLGFRTKKNKMKTSKSRMRERRDKEREKERMKNGQEGCLSGLSETEF